MNKVLASIGFLFIAICADAQSVKLSINGYPNVTVTTREVRLASIASIGAQINLSDAQEKAAQELRNLVITQSPEPGRMSQISGQGVVDRLRELGVVLDAIVYSFPEQITIQRAGRKPSNEELFAATENFLQLQSSDLELTAVSTSPKTKLFTDSIQYQGVRSRQIRPGIIEVLLQAISGSGETMQVPVQASVNQWKEVAVAARPIKRGTVVDGEDVAHARMNLAQLPNNTLSDIISLVGMVASKDITAGESFKSTSLLVPSVITQGSKVIIQVQTGLLQAKAEGIALENGNRGQMIRVKNVASNKTIQATVKEQGVVEVVL